MAKRTQSITADALNGLYLNHPYLRIFQKDDWQDYALLLAQIYDLLEEGAAVIPYETLRSLLIQFYSNQKNQNPEQKVLNFISMSIAELHVLKDRHDHLGNRFIETTRSGKDLLKMLESMLSEKVRFTGLSAESMLGSLNNLFLQQKLMTQDEAVSHHRERIKAYQQDIKLIEKYGVSRAELLPAGYAKEELLQQAEEAALHILTAVEDVKIGISNVRRDLAEGYFREDRSAGKSINVVADFYHELENSPEYRSYTQAFDLLSYIDGLGSRFRYRDTEEMLEIALQEKIFDRETLARSHLRGFKQKFYRDHRAIEEQKKTQLHLLQQQVAYAISLESRKVEQELKEIVALLYENKDLGLSFFDESGIGVTLPTDLQWGQVVMCSFEVPIETPSQSLEYNEIRADEMQALAKALLEAEEATIQKTLDRLRTELLRSPGSIQLSKYHLEWGLTEFYVLMQVDLFSSDFVKEWCGKADVKVQSRFGEYYIKDSDDYKIFRAEGK